MTFGQETAEWPKIATLRVEARDGTTGRTLFDGPVENAAIDLGETAPDATVLLVGEARDAGGVVVARGRTASFGGAELAGVTVPLLLSPVGGASRASAGLLGGRTRASSGGATLLAGRYVLLTSTGEDGGSGELYDTGLLATLVGGPTWPRPPRSVLRASTRDLLIVDEAGASFVDAIASGAPTTSSLSPADAAALVYGQILEGARAAATPDIATGRWLAGPCRRAREGAVASDRVLFLDAADGLVVTRLAAPRLGATCAVAPGGSLLVAGGGIATLASIDPSGTVTEIPLADDRSFGAGLIGEDGSLSLLGGHDAAGGVPAPVRVAFPCAASCVALPATFGALDRDVALRDLEALPTTTGRAFFVADDGLQTRVFFATATATATQLVAISTRRTRSSADAFVLPGERLLLAGGRDTAGAVLDVEILTPP